jgi:pimeloyl-ACP methyl ester carboxylesterase
MRLMVLLLSLALFISAPVFRFSHVDFVYGEAHLRASATFQPAVANQPILVFMHTLDTSASDFTRSIRERFAEYGVFALFVEMRGRGGSGGTPDASGLEIQDIVEAVEYVKHFYPHHIDPSQLHIAGYSGGGGNALAAAARFPDYFNSVTSFFGISDYGHDPETGWYQSSADEIQRAFLEAWIGGSPDTVPDRYHARYSLGALTNYQGRLWMFHDRGDTNVPAAQSLLVTEVLSRADLSNVTLNLTSNGDRVRWLHEYPHDGSPLIEAEALFMPPIVAREYPNLTIPQRGVFKIAGYLVTKRFEIWLGDGTDEFGEVHYDWVARTFGITAETAPSSFVLLVKNGMPDRPVTVTINEVVHTEAANTAGVITFRGHIDS